jgi:hypothetical protein
MSVWKLREDEKVWNVRRRCVRTRWDVIRLLLRTQSGRHYIEASSKVISLALPVTLYFTLIAGPFGPMLGYELLKDRPIYE